MPSYLIEASYRDQYSLIAGVDEAGRGPLAGPVHAAATILPEDYKPSWLGVLDDSKKLSSRKREELYKHITNDKKIIWAIAEASVKEIDTLNILNATHLAMRRATQALSCHPEFCLIDGSPVKEFPYPCEAIVKGDSKSYSIAAASILAKVARDNLMMELDEKYPLYQFCKHKGYGTKAHMAALQEHGPCSQHRLSFRPVQEAHAKTQE